MASKSGIEWTDATWTPIRARVRDDAKAIAELKGYASLLPIIQPGRVGPHCEHASPGCLHCYSETNNGRCLPTNGTGLPFDRRSRDLVEVFIDANMIAQPLIWRKPRRIFVCSQTDMFGDWVTDDMLITMFTVMGNVHIATGGENTHALQVLTKQAKRMQSFMSRLRWRLGLGFATLGRNFPVNYMPYTDTCDPWVHGNTGAIPPKEMEYGWMPPWIWLGVSAEDQQRADERIPLLLQTPAAVRFVSYEPALEAVDFGLGRWVNLPMAVRSELPFSLSVATPGAYRAKSNKYGALAVTANEGLLGVKPGEFERLPLLSWIIGGAESGPGARPMNEEWMRSAKDQCVEAGVAFFYKQNAVKGKKLPTPELDGRQWMQFPTPTLASGGAK